jgi:putative holliday junction resolvase
VTHDRRRVLGVDLGSRRIGLAASDPSGVLASPHSTIERSGDGTADLQAIVAAARDIGAGCIVVGLPRSLSGKLGPAARSALTEIETLRELTRPDSIEVDTYDERFTTMIAQQGLREAHVRQGARRRARRERVDAAAAAVILQGWLDAHGPRPAPGEDPGLGETS